MKRNPIETVDTPAGARPARLNPVEVEVIHLFVQLSRALGHPCKIYNMLSVAAPVIYIGPKPSHVTEVLDVIGKEHPQIRVEHGEAERLAIEIRRLAATTAGCRPQLPQATLAGFSKSALLPKMIEAIEGTDVGKTTASSSTKRGFN